MADGDVQPSSNPRGGRGPRDGAGREPGGFRIRLSDNEMRAARAVQEAFGLRSTVAALGLSIRTVAQLLEEGKLDEVLAQHRASGGGRPSGGGERRGPRPERGERPSNRPNPFARPARPAAAAPAAAAEVEPAGDSEPAADAVIETSETASADA
ncbi:MAG: hypothetical protein RLZZ186_888 [Cyanobacteriota bacterium]